MQPPFSTFFEAQRPEVVQAIAQDLAAQIDCYRGLSSPALSELAGHFAGFFLDGPGEPAEAAVDRWIHAHLGRAGGHPSEIESLVHGIAIARRHIFRCAGPAVDQQMPGAWEGLRQWGELADAMTARLLHQAHDSTFYNRVPVMMHSLDGEGKLIRVNAKWLECMGFTREEVIGKHIWSLMTEASSSRAKTTLKNLFHHGGGSKLPFELVKKTGEIIEIEADVTVEKDDSGKVIQTFASLSDVTERNRIDRVLRESEQRYRNLVELSPDGIAVQRGGIVIYANAAAVRILGAQNPSELIGRHVFEIIHPDYHELVKQRIREATTSMAPAPMIDEKFVRIDGTAVDVEVTGVPVLYEGEPAIQLIFRDITERKRAQEALQKNAMQEEMIRTQEVRLRALSTPLIPLTEKVVLMPLIGNIDAPRATQILETLLDGVTAHGATIAIMDVTGVPMIDSHVAEALRRTTHAVKLLGAEVVLTGIRPATAQTLVQLGTDLAGIITRGTLRSGIAYAFGKARSRE